LSSPVILHVIPGHMSNIMTMSWAPLVFACVEMMVRKRSALAALVTGVVVACQFLGGHAQYFYYSMLGAGLYFWYRAIEDSIERRSLKSLGMHVGRYALAMGGGMALCAVQVLPMLELVGESVRRAAEGREWAATFSFPPENLGTLMVPDLFGDDLSFRYWGRWYSWEMIAYFGVGTLVLGLLSLVLRGTRRVWFFAGLGGFAALAALGGHTPLLSVLQRALPGFGLFRGHSKFVFLLGLCLAVLAGMGMDAFLRAEGEGERKRVRRACWVLGSVGLLGLVVWLVMGGEIGTGEGIWRGIVGGMGRVKRSLIAGAPPWILEDWAKKSYAGFQRSLTFSTVLLVLTAGLLALGLLKPRLRKVTAAGVAGLLLADLWAFGTKRVEPVVAAVRPWEGREREVEGQARAPLAFALESCFFQKELEEFFKSRGEPFRVMDMGVPYTLLPAYVTEKVETIMGFSPVTPGRYQRFFNYSEGRPLEEMSAGIIPVKAGRLYSLLNMRYVITTAEWDSVNEEKYDAAQLDRQMRSGAITRERYERVPRIEAELVFEGGGLRVFENEGALSRAYLVHAYEMVTGDEAILERLSAGDFDAKRTVVLEEEVEGLVAPGEGGADERVEILSYEPERVVVEVTTKSPGILVLGDMYYPGWRAEVDGEEVPIYRANYLVRGVRVDEGEHAVVFEYRPRPYRVGRVISLIALCLFAAGVAGLGYRGFRRG